MRQIVLDTESTGFEPSEGHRLVEIGCLELINFVPTKNVFHVYINPERDVPAEAVAVHNLTTEFLQDKPLFHKVADDFLAFVADSPLVIHNAQFDCKFLNFELTKSGRPPLGNEIIDTLAMARAKFPGRPNSLDALTKRFNITDFDREYHGALLDSRILAKVYLELVGGEQAGLTLSEEAAAKGASQQAAAQKLELSDRPQRPARPWPLSADEKAAHEVFLTKLTNPLWDGVKNKIDPAA